MCINVSMYIVYDNQQLSFNGIGLIVESKIYKQNFCIGTLYTYLLM